MLMDVVEARPLDGYRFFLRFEDGVEGVLDLTDLVRFEGVFAPLSDREAFRQLRVDADLGTVCWPTGADLDPGVLYSRITSGTPAPSKA